MGLAFVNVTDMIASNSVSGISTSHTLTVTKAHSGSSFQFPYEPSIKPESFAYFNSLGHMPKGSESKTIPVRSYALINSMAPCELPALTSPVGTDLALLMKTIGKVSYLQANSMQVSRLKKDTVT